MVTRSEAPSRCPNMANTAREGINRAFAIAWIALNSTQRHGLSGCGLDHCNMFLEVLVRRIMIAGLSIAFCPHEFKYRAGICSAECDSQNSVATYGEVAPWRGSLIGTIIAEAERPARKRKGSLPRTRSRSKRLWTPRLSSVEAMRSSWLQWPPGSLWPKGRRSLRLT